MTVAISAAMVKQLRDHTGLGMMECKKALVESEGDFERARDLLRIRGGAKAGKVSGRAVTEGRIACAVAGTIGAMVEIACETDFVARDETLAAFAAAVADALAATGETVMNKSDPEDPLETAKFLTLADGQAVEDARQALVMKVGENIRIRRARLMRGRGDICFYLHTGDKIGVLSDVAGGDQALKKDVCLHIAAMNPHYIDETGIPAADIAREKNIIAAQVAQSGKPPPVAEKIVNGRWGKFLAEIVLHKQPFIKDPDKIMSELLADSGARVHQFCRFVVGESLRS